MISARRILTIVGTLFTALAAGFMMQYIMDSPDERTQGVQVASVAPVTSQPLTDAVIEEPALAQAPTLEDAEPSVAEDAKEPALAEDVSTEPAQPETESVEVASTEALSTEIIETEQALDDVDLSADVPQTPSFAPQPDLLPEEPVTLAALDDEPVNTIMPREEPAPSFACETKVVALTSAAAMVDLVLDAACHANEGFTVHHNGMMVSGMTDADGLASMMLPALSEKAVYIVTFAGGKTVVASAEVTSVQDYDRAIVQWSAYDGLQVHALEYGASYDEPGHVWSGATGELSKTVMGEGGFMMQVGETTPLTTHMAEIYTFPSATASSEGTIELSLEAVVTEANCGRDLEAQILQKSGAEPMTARDLTLAMPDCDAIGDFLVLKNMFDDLNIARN